VNFVWRPQSKSPVELLLVEDDPSIYDTLEPYARKMGWQLSWSRSVPEARRALEESAPDVVLLDRGLPTMKGDILTADLVARSIPFVMLTACGAEDERLAGFDLGADDYITKPFSVPELVRRIDVVLRRRGSPRIRLLEDLELDRESRKLLANGVDVGLTEHECKLLECLMRRPGRFYTRQEIADNLDLDLDTSERAIDSHVKNLRRKLRNAGVEETLIETAVGVGYALHTVA
jgi:two-component system response regulator BaeR